MKPPEAPEAGPAFDVRRLQSLLEQAQRESTRLQQFIRSGAACETEMINTVARLDERLSVGAQILGAFQHQIERIEDAVQTALALEQRNRALYEAIAELLDSHTTGSPRDGGQQCEGDAASIHPSL